MAPAKILCAKEHNLPSTFFEGYVKLQGCTTVYSTAKCTPGNCFCLCLFFSYHWTSCLSRDVTGMPAVKYLWLQWHKQWNQCRNGKWQQTCMFVRVCLIPLLTIFTLKALPEKTMNLLSHPTIKDVHHYRIVSMRSLVPQNLQQKKHPTSGGVDHPIPEASKFTKFLRHIQHKI